MEKELDLTLKLGLPNPTVETHLSLNTPTTDQVPTTNQGTTNVVDGGGRGDNNNNGGENFNYLRRALWGNDEVIDDEGARNNVDVNIRVYNYIFQQFAGMGDTLNFAPFPMPPSSPSPPPAPVTPPVSDYVLIDVPARRAHRNNSLAMANAWNENANANANAMRRLRGCGGLCGGRVEGTRKCTNMNCNALTTPMWRSGPLGPKSLCNACGIKFRKEEERKSKRN